MGAPQQPKLRLKDRRRRLVWVKVAAGASVVALSLALVFYVARLPSLTISKVEVSGAGFVNPNDVQSLAEAKLSGSYAFFVPHANTFVAPVAAIKNSIMASFPPVGSVSISKKGTMLLVALTERQTAALWCGAALPENGKAEDCYLMDGGGFIFAKADSDSGFVRYYGVASTTPIGATYLGGSFAALDATVRGISASIKRTPETVATDAATNDTSLAFVEGGILRFERNLDETSTIENVASVFASQSFKDHTDFEYVDFRFGDKVYVKFK